MAYLFNREHNRRQRECCDITGREGQPVLTEKAGALLPETKVRDMGTDSPMSIDPAVLHPVPHLKV